MNELLIYRGALVFAAVLELVFTAWILRLRPADREKLDRIPRARKTGIALGFLALLWCVPHARPIVFDWMLPLLYPAVIVCTVLAYFFVDYLLSRALGGIFILGAYFFVHGAFDFHTPGTAGLSLLYWGLGIAGICFSGKPCWMRDLLRKCADDPRVRYFAAFYAVLLALASVAAAILTRGGAA